MAANVRHELTSRGLSQAAAAAGIGVSVQVLNDRLRGRTPFRIDQVIALASWLGIPASELMEERTAQPIPA